MLGVLGGMGPLATVDFMRKLIDATAAQRDQDHIPMIVCSIPQIPDRTEAITSHGPDPLPRMLRGISILEEAGATMVAVPCNTAHYWHSSLADFSTLPVLNMVDACLSELTEAGIGKANVGILATKGTIAAGVYQKRFAEAGILFSLPSDQDAVMEGIRLVKANHIAQATGLLLAEVGKLLSNGCTHILMGCTEIPIALAEAAMNAPDRFIDPSAALARLCVRRFPSAKLARPIVTGNRATSAVLQPGIGLS